MGRNMQQPGMLYLLNDFLQSQILNIWRLRVPSMLPQKVKNVVYFVFAFVQGCNGTRFHAEVGCTVTADRNRSLSIRGRGGGGSHRGNRALLPICFTLLQL